MATRLDRSFRTTWLPAACWLLVAGVVWGQPSSPPTTGSPRAVIAVWHGNRCVRAEPAEGHAGQIRVLLGHQVMQVGSPGAQPPPGPVPLPTAPVKLAPSAPCDQLPRASG